MIYCLTNRLATIPQNDEKIAIDIGSRNGIGKAIALVLKLIFFSY